MEDFPYILLDAATAKGLSPKQRALIEAPELREFWKRLAAHVPALTARGWSSLDAAAALVGSVVVPLAFGHDAHGSATRRVRGGIDMARRRKAARDARALAKALRAIAREPLAPDEVLSVLACLPEEMCDMIGPDTPSYVWTFRTADALARLADALEAEPDLSMVPGLASRKASWRGFIREVVANLSDYDFAIREVEAVRLVEALFHAEDMPVLPSRESVRDAMHWRDSE